MNDLGRVVGVPRSTPTPSGLGQTHDGVTVGESGQTERWLLFSVLVWPALEGDAPHNERVREVLGVLHAGAMDRNGSTRYDTDGALRWDPKREVWVGSDGFAHDGERLRAYSRQGDANA